MNTTQHSINPPEVEQKNADVAAIIESFKDKILSLPEPLQLKAADAAIKTLERIEADAKFSVSMDPERINAYYKKAVARYEPKTMNRYTLKASECRDIAIKYNAVADVVIFAFNLGFARGINMAAAHSNEK